jgi:GT2 family glycosyltransferase
MILQNLQFPEQIDPLYIRVSEKEVCIQKKEMTIGAQGTVAFTTYYNSFSLKKWKKYTVVDKIFLKLTAKGRFEVTLLGFNAVRSVQGSLNNCFVEKIFAKETVELSEPAEYKIAYPDCDYDLIAFKIRAFESAELYSGAYYADIDEDLPEVNLALAICTYKREQYIKTNMDMLNETVFFNKDSILKEHIRVYIADNGQTLRKEEIESDTVKLFPNINAGGAGGFSRCMIEALVDKDRYNLTHIVLMDDDIFFTCDTLERTYTFFRLLKKEHRNIMLGSAMLLMDKPHIQHAAGEAINHDGLTRYKADRDLTELRSVVSNELEEPINYCAWWYCCFPLERTKDNLAMPFFFQYDDTEWGLRNKDLEKIVINGVCVRHEAFVTKRSEWKDYFLLRNRHVVTAIYGDSVFGGCGKMYFLRLVFIRILYRIALFRHKEAELMMRAVEDYCRGLGWLATVDPAVVLGEVQQYTSKTNLLTVITLTVRLMRLLRHFGLTFKQTVKHYREDYRKYTTEDFWRKYLGLKSEV